MKEGGPAITAFIADSIINMGKKSKKSVTIFT
jgi:hypothetical protein